MSTPPSPELLQMLLADARLPTAGHTQSAGLEPAVAAGIRSAEVPEYIGLRLRTVTRVDAATAAVALYHLRHGLQLDDVEIAWAARTPSPAMRATSRAMAKGMQRLVRRLWPDDPSIRVLPTGVSRPIVMAAAADVCRLDSVALARLIGYDDVQTVASAALKLLPLDPAEVTAWVLAALPAVDLLAGEVAALTSPAEIPASGAPQFEAWAEDHAVASRRLFSA